MHVMRTLQIGTNFKQAGAELCQAQVKLSWLASSFSLQYKLSLSLKICFEDSSKKILVSQG